MSETFYNACQRCKMSEDTDEQKLYPVLSDLLRLFVLSNLKMYMDWFLAQNYMTKKQMFAIKDEITDLIVSLRKHAVPLVDAFDISDFLLRSPIGIKSGKCMFLQ